MELRLILVWIQDWEPGEESWPGCAIHYIGKVFLKRNGSLQGISLWRSFWGSRTHINGLVVKYTFFFFGCAHSMRKFLGQGSNLRHSSDNTGSLTCCTTMDHEREDTCVAVECQPGNSVRDQENPERARHSAPTAQEGQGRCPAKERADELLRRQREASAKAAALGKGFSPLKDSPVLLWSQS